MAASFLKRKPKEPERPQRVELPAVEADPELGLTGEQVHERLAGGWDNRPVEPPGATVQQIIVKNVCTYFNFLFFLLAGCVIAVRQWLNLTFLGPVFCNMFIGIVQDLRVKKKVDNLRIMSAPKCRAVRDGQIVQTEAAALVRDDIAVGHFPGHEHPELHGRLKARQKREHEQGGDQDEEAHAVMMLPEQRPRYPGKLIDAKRGVSRSHHRPVLFVRPEGGVPRRRK